MNDEKVEALVKMVDAALHQTTIAFSLLLDELYGEKDEPIDLAPPKDFVASEDPVLCQHPNRITALDQELCDSCGTNLSG